MSKPEALRNIGIFAHVDAGKTTLSEQLLLRSGAIREAGSVDRGTAHTDMLPIEQRRGISVKATCVRLRWRDTEINWIDTPGHTDFSTEIERSLWALDGAVLVISAPEGVEPQTELLFQALHRERVPVILFLNKCDRPNIDLETVLRQIRRRLSSAVIPLDENLVESVCAEDEELMERYLLEEPVSLEEARASLGRMTREGSAFPLLRGSALRGEGVDPLLDAMLDFLPAPETTRSELCGIAFAAQPDLAARLCSGLYLAAHISVKGGNDHFAAKHRRAVRDLCNGIQILSLSLISFAFFDLYFQEKVARRSALASGHAFSLQADLLPAVDACRNVYLQGDRPAGGGIGIADQPVSPQSRVIKIHSDPGGHVRAVSLRNPPSPEL